MSESTTRLGGALLVALGVALLALLAMRPTSISAQVTSATAFDACADAR